MNQPSIQSLAGSLSETGTNELRRINLSDFTDAHICEERIDRSIIFPGPRLPMPEEIELLGVFLQMSKKFSSVEFMFNYMGYAFRGHREDRATDGTWYRLRRLPLESPCLSSLPSPLPTWLSSLLLDETLKSGGLLYFIGAPAQGKTTTASATLVSRLQKFGGYALTIEDPPEMPLSGWHGGGYCSQTWINDQSENSWGEGIKGALRSMPANTPSMLYIGEVRDHDCATTMLRAASNGFLVLATGFATDIPSGLQALSRIAGDNESTHQMMANALRLALHLQIIDGGLRTSPLVSANSSSSVAKRIRQNEYNQLQNDINIQQAMIRKGESLTFYR